MGNKDWNSRSKTKDWNSRSKTKDWNSRSKTKNKDQDNSKRGKRKGEKGYKCSEAQKKFGPNTREWNPHCGINKDTATRATYGNRRGACMGPSDFVFRGKCSKQKGDICTRREKQTRFCNRMLSPVCCINVQTGVRKSYGNRCEGCSHKNDICFSGYC